MTLLVATIDFFFYIQIWTLKTEKKQYLEIRIYKIVGSSVKLSVFRQK